MDAYIGQIEAFAFGFCPRGWAFCDGRELPISQYSALFALLGTAFGGNGQTTFALPDLRGRAVIGSNRSAAANGPLCEVGKTMGSERHALIFPELPLHNHPAPAVAPAAAGATLAMPVAAAEPTADMANVATQAVGNGEPHDNMMPSLGANYCICVQGIFPSRD